MGSSGSSTLGDYKPGPTDKCGQSIDSDLEDVAQSDFYQQKKALPAKETAVRLRATLRNRRLTVDEAASGLSIGNLPTKFNYLALCLKGGWKHAGTVTASLGWKLPVVEVHLDPV